MNFKTWTVGIAVLTLSAAPAFAETEVGQWSFDQNVVPVGCCDDCCCGDDCCGDCCCGDDCCGDDCCGGCCDCGCGCGGTGLLSGVGPGYLEGFSLSDRLGFTAFTVGGWTQFGWTDDAVPLSPQGSNGTNGSFLDVPDRFNLHQQYFFAERVADGSRGFDVGFRADLMYGTDGDTAQAFGNPPGSWDFQNGFDHGVYAWALPQMYGEIAINDLSVKIGHFYTIMGYEVVTAPDNFFFSHASTLCNSEPFTHTGVLGTYTVVENLTLYGGWTLGWDTGFDNLNEGNNFLGGFSVGLSDAITMTWTNAYGNFGAITQDGSEDFAQSIVVDVNVTDRVNYVFQTDYKKIDGSDDEDVGINQYLFYNFNDWLAFGNRIEWWRDGTGSPYANGDRVSNYNYTTGVNIRVFYNLVFRPEARTDWAPAGDFSVNNVACDMILTY